MSYDSAALAELDWRGLIDDLSAEELDEALGDGSVSFYCGFDPTSDSLQVGNLLPVMVMAHLYRQGHRPVALAGGATGRIGDPSGRSSERDLLGDEELERNLSAISSQLESIFERALTFRSERASRAEGDGDVAVRNNDEWLGEFRYVDFLRDVGKHFRVNKMINKESVRSRLEDRDQGISYTEFSYMLLQAYDFLHLYREEDCRLQVGGSDQWGNITAGIDLVRRKEGEEVFGLTAPLVTTPAGEKLGKTADGTVWLDPEKTSPYEFYQYWIRRRDGEMPELLRMFTFLPEEEVVELSEFAQSDEHRGEVQERLALEVTKLVHGERLAYSAELASEMFFGDRTVREMDEKELSDVFEVVDVPSGSVDRSRLEGEGVEIRDLMVETGFRDSRGDAKRLIRQGGAYLNDERIEDLRYHATSDDLLTPSMLVLRSGKKDYHLVRIVD